MTVIFSNEFLREMNAKAHLIAEAEAVRKKDNLKYSKLVEKHKAKYRQLSLLPIKQLQVLVEDLVNGR
jgi:hypothetical protein